MTPERWARMKELYHAALELPQDERRAFLELACGADNRLLQDVQKLLAATPDLPSPVAGSWTAIPAGSMLGRYRVDAEVGRGGMGAVYRAFDTDLLRPVALKVLPPEFRADPQRRERLLREARAASPMKHPNIVTIYEAGSDRGIDFIAMEFVEGERLDTLILPGGIAVEQALEYALQIAAGLERAHAAGIIHRDLKPHNMMLSRSGGLRVLKLLDFGLARQVPVSAAARVSLTAEGEIAGTPAYMSPEQVQGKAVDTRSDIFSFGAVLYEMLSGRKAFDGNSTIAVLSAVLRDEPTPLTGVPEELAKLVNRCLRKDPERRMQHIEDVRVILQDLRAEVVAPASLHVKRRNYRGPFFAAGVLAIAGLVALWAAWNHRSNPSEMRLVPLTAYPGVETAPAFSPDGTQVAFSWNGDKQENFDIYVTLAGSGARPLRLTDDAALDTSPAWSPDGRQVAFVRRTDGRAAVQLISPLGGHERRAAELHASDSRVPLLAWSPDGRWLAVADEDASGVRGIFAIPSGAGERHRLTTNRLSLDYSPAFSPDGRHLAFVSCKDSYACDLFVMELGAGCVAAEAPVQVTHQGVYIGGIAWDGDGKNLIYEASDDVDLNAYLWRTRAFGGGAPARMELTGRQARRPAVSRAGNRLAFSRGGEDEDIWKYEQGGPASSFISSTLYEYNPAYSPDGAKIAFSSNRSGRMEIWTCDEGGSNLVQLTDGPGRHQGGPQWSPDGHSIAFSSQAENGIWGVFVVDAAGGQPRRVTPPDMSAYTTSWSRDGKWLYYSTNATGRLELWRIPAMGGTSIQVTDSGGFIGMESWDGKTLYYYKAREQGTTTLYARGLPSGRERVASVAPVNDTLGVGSEGVYFFAKSPEGSFALQLLSPGAPAPRTLTMVHAAPNLRLSVSPSGKAVLFGAAKPADADLVLIENFR
jgi:eukaryotic-like serine/threonine-protein kinase